MKITTPHEPSCWTHSINDRIQALTGRRAASTERAITTTASKIHFVRGFILKEGRGDRASGKLFSPSQSIGFCCTCPPSCAPAPITSDKREWRQRFSPIRSRISSPGQTHGEVLPHFRRPALPPGSYRFLLPQQLWQNRSLRFRRRPDRRPPVSARSHRNRRSVRGPPSRSVPPSQSPGRCRCTMEPPSNPFSAAGFSEASECFEPRRGPGHPPCG